MLYDPAKGRGVTTGCCLKWGSRYALSSDVNKAKKIQGQCQKFWHWDQGLISLPSSRVYLGHKTDSSFVDSTHEVFIHSSSSVYVFAAAIRHYELKSIFFIFLNFSLQINLLQWCVRHSDRCNVERSFILAFHRVLISCGAKELFW